MSININDIGAQFATLAITVGVMLALIGVASVVLTAYWNGRGGEHKTANEEYIDRVTRGLNR